MKHIKIIEPREGRFLEVPVEFVSGLDDSSGCCVEGVDGSSDSVDGDAFSSTEKEDFV